MKQSDLHRRYADVVDLCEGTQVNPSSRGVKYDGNISIQSTFTGNPELYEFMIAIVEDKPVFAGDVLYHKDGNKYKVQQIEKHSDGRVAFRTVAFPWVDGDWIENYSWNPPKDEYAELKRAQSKGEKIAWFSDEGFWYIQSHISDELFTQHPVERWKIVEDDLVIEHKVSPFSSDIVRIRITKSGLDGKIRAEVI